jgi:primary-amine oxidase
VLHTQDGTIAHEVKLTGILATSLLPPGEERPSHGILVAPRVSATAHQHLFCARLDMAVDDEQGGRSLVVSEVCCSACVVGAARRLMWRLLRRASHRVVRATVCTATRTLQVDARQQPTSDSHNPLGNAFTCDETDLPSVHAAQRLAAPHLNRVWRIKNPQRLHRSR